MAHRAIARARALVGAGALAIVSPALTSAARAADDAAGDAFTYGLAEMRAGRYATGCPAIEASYRLDPRPGTLFTLAECNLKRGKTASALADYEQFIALCAHMSPAQRSAQADRLAVANEERASLAPAVPHLVLRLSDPNARDLTVRCDDVVLSGPMLGAPFPVDPGVHTILSETPDGRKRTIQVSVAEGEQRVVEVEAPAAAEPTPKPTAAPPLALSPAPAPASSQRTWSYAVGAAGLVGIAVAGTTGILSIAKASTARSSCDAMGVCSSPAGVDAGNAAHALADVSTVSWVVGVVGLAAAAVLFLTAPQAPHATPSAAIGRRAHSTPALSLFESIGTW
jgi:hypothetical protein